MVSGKLCVCAAIVAAAALVPNRSTAVPQAFAWQTATPESQGMSSVALDTLKDRLAAANTKALLVIRHDGVVSEWYAPDHSAATRHYTASMAKAIVGGVAVGLGLSDRRIALDDNVADYVPQWKADPCKSRITIRQLGSHASGLEDAEADGLPHEKLTGWKGDFWKRLDPPNDPFTIARDRTPIAGRLANLVDLFDGVAYIGALLFVVAASLIAAAVPTVRAARIDPATTLRQE
jgi:CubicO group peptidase (beta-lactamase class C family)